MRSCREERVGRKKNFKEKRVLEEKVGRKRSCKEVPIAFL